MNHERTHIDLFSGIAGFSEAARACGVRTIAMCEQDPDCREYLAKAWPAVPVWPDIRTFGVGEPERNGRSARKPSAKTTGHGRSAESAACGSVAGAVWLVTAGCPCQPGSRAGKQRGADDDRWLWDEAVSVLARIRPAWAIFENPPGVEDLFEYGVSLEVDGEGIPVAPVGTVVDREGPSIFCEVLESIEACGYALHVYGIPACALGAPHRRMRYWIVAKHVADVRGEGWGGQPAGVSRDHGKEQPPIERSAARGVGESERIDVGRRRRPEGLPSGPFGEHERSSPWRNSIWLPCADGKVRRAPDSAVQLVDGRPVDIIAQLAKEGWPKRSVLKAIGNSIVYQVAAEIIQAMIQSEI